MANSALMQYSLSSKFTCFLPLLFTLCILSNYSFYSHSTSTSSHRETPSILYISTYVCLFTYTCQGKHLSPFYIFPTIKTNIPPTELSLKSQGFLLYHHLAVIQPLNCELKTSLHHRLCSTSPAIRSIALDGTVFKTVCWDKTHSPSIISTRRSINLESSRNLQQKRPS